MPRQLDPNHDKNIKNAILAALTDEPILVGEIFKRANLQGRTSIPRTGTLLKALVAAEKVDCTIKWGVPRYKKGTGITYHEPNVRDTTPPHLAVTKISGGNDIKLGPELKKGSLDGLPYPQGSKAPPAPSVIPAGDDYLVFTNIAKIKCEGPDRVRVFYAVQGLEDYPLATDVYEGRAARDIFAAFDQRLNGWISLDMVNQLKETVASLEDEIKALKAELKAANGRLEAIRKATA